jgi:hypothetical protein
MTEDAGTQAEIPGGPPGRSGEPIRPAVEEAGRQLRAPWAASIAGLLFAILFTVALLLLRTQPSIGASDAELVHQFATGVVARLKATGKANAQATASIQRHIDAIKNGTHPAKPAHPAKP